MNCKQMSILLVEPDDYDLSVTAALIENCPQPFTLLTARNHEEAVQKLGYFRPDLILTELSLSEGSELQALEMIVEAAGNIPVIVLSSWALSYLDLDAIQCGAEDFLTKGDIDEETLGRSIKFAIERTKRFVRTSVRGVAAS